MTVLRTRGCGSSNVMMPPIANLQPRPHVAPLPPDASKSEDPTHAQSQTSTYTTAPQPPAHHTQKGAYAVHNDADPAPPLFETVLHNAESRTQMACALYNVAYEIKPLEGCTKAGEGKVEAVLTPFPMAAILLSGSWDTRRSGMMDRRPGIFLPPSLYEVRVYLAAGKNYFPVSPQRKLEGYPCREVLGRYGA